MKRSLIPSMIFSILILTACLSPRSGGASTPTMASAPSETPSPTATETPTPSLESLLPQEVKEKFELAGIDLANMQNAKYDKDGLHITLPSGEVIVLTNDQLQKGIYNGQDNVLQYRDEANQNVIYAFDKESGNWGVASLSIDNLDTKKWGNYSIIENSNGYYEMKDVQGNLIPEVKLFRDGIAELTYSSKKLAIAFQAVSIGKEGQLSLGLWDFKNGEWSMTPGYTAEDVRAGEFVDDYHKLVVIRGNDEIEKKLTDTIFMARDLYMNNTEGYRPESEFENISVTVNFKTIDNFDVRPKEWQIKNWGRNRPGEFILNPVPSNREVGYDYFVSSTTHARPMQPATGSGWFNLEIYDKVGTSQPPTVHVPVVAMNADRSLTNMSALLRQSDLEKIAHLLTKDGRGKLYFGLYKNFVKDDSVLMVDNQLISFTVEANHEYFEAVEWPELGNGVSTSDEVWSFKSLPKELSQMFLTLLTRPEYLN